MAIKKAKNKMYNYQVKDALLMSSFRRTLIKFVIYTSLFFIALAVTIIPHLLTKKTNQHRQMLRYPTDLKYVLFLNRPKDKRKIFNSKPEYAEGQTLFVKQKCQFINCYITYNKSLLRQDIRNFDAVVFDVRDIKHIHSKNILFDRSPHQKYIFRSFDPSDKYPLCSSVFDDFFNWTWTYKLNSDIPHPFINIFDVKNKLVGPRRKVNWVMPMNHTEKNKNKMKFKNKAVAWVINRCVLKNKHQDFIDELRNELKGYNYTVDLFGSCGENKCAGALYKCYKAVEKEYYFQLVLEDGFGQDFVTENVMKALNHVTIPIVLGATNYSSFLPPGSYINAESFDLKKLGALIDYLIKNPVMYSYFFDWKNHYFYTARPRLSVCDLCTKLNHNHSVVTRKSYKHFRKWWNPDYKDSCQSIRLLNLFANE